MAYRFLGLCAFLASQLPTLPFCTGHSSDSWLEERDDNEANERCAAAATKRWPGERVGGWGRVVPGFQARLLDVKAPFSLENWSPGSGRAPNIYLALPGSTLFNSRMSSQDTPLVRCR